MDAPKPESDEKSSSTQTKNSSPQTENSSPQSPPSSDGGYKKIPNPLLKLKVKGNLDLLDEDDIIAHMPKAYAAALFKSTIALRAMDPTDNRLKEQFAQLKIEFRLSIQDLLDFKCGRKTVADTKEKTLTLAIDSTEQPIHPCVSFPFMSNKDGNTKIVPFMANASVLQSEFKGLLKEDLKFGTNISENYLEVQQHLEKTQPITNYLVKKSQGILTFNFDSESICDEEKKKSNGKTWNLLPMITKDEIDTICHTAFLEDNTIDSGVIRYKLDESSEYCYVPDEHGMAQYIKKNMPMVVSTVRVYTMSIGTSMSKLYLRLPTRCYDEAKELLKKEFSGGTSRETTLKDTCFWVGYKEPGEGWEDKEEKNRLANMSEEERTKKRSVVIKLNFVYLELNKDRTDMFCAQKKTVGAFLPGIQYLDAIINKQQELSAETKEKEHFPAYAKTLRTLPEISARAMPYYLKDNLHERKRIKEGREEPKQALTYLEKLNEK